MYDEIVSVVVLITTNAQIKKMVRNGAGIEVADVLVSSDRFFQENLPVLAMTRSSRRTPVTGASNASTTSASGRSFLKGKNKRNATAHIVPTQLSVSFEKKNGMKRQAVESDVARGSEPVRKTRVAPLASSECLRRGEIDLTRIGGSVLPSAPGTTTTTTTRTTPAPTQEGQLLKKSESWSHPDHFQHSKPDMNGDDDGSASDTFLPEGEKEGKDSGTILTGRLLKRGNRNKYLWNRRHFVFTRDCKLLIYRLPSGSAAAGDDNATLNQQQDHQQQHEERLKDVYDISKQAGCEIGNLFVDQRMRGPKKELIYCFRIKWSWEDGPDGSSNREQEHQQPPLKPDEASYNSSSVHQQPHLKQSMPPSPAQSIDEFLYPLDPMSPSSENDKDKDTSSAEFVLSSPKGHRRRRTWGDRDIYYSDSEPSRTRDRSNRPKKMATRAVSSASKTASKSIGYIYNQSIGKGKGKGDKEKKVSKTSEEETGQTNAAQSLYDEQRVAEQDILREEYKTVRREKKRVAKKKAAQTVKVAAAATAAVGIGVITTGVGLAAGLALVGVAAGGSGAALGMRTNRKKNTNVSEIVIGTDSYEEAKKWKSTLDAYLQFETVKESTWGQLFFSPRGNHPKNARFPTDIVFSNAPMNSPHRGVDEISAKSRNKMSFGERQINFEPTSQWRPLEGGWASLLGNGVQGLRIFKEEKVKDTELPPIKLSGHRPVLKVFTKLSVDGPPCPPMKAHLVLNTAPLNAFLCLMSNSHVASAGEIDVTSFSPKSDQGASFRIIERLDDHMDVIHFVFRPIYLFPSWTSPRDYVMVRYWRVEQDGTYVVIYESVQHRDCPPHPDFVRGEMHQVYTISPRKKNSSKSKGSSSSSKMKRGSSTSVNNQLECLISAVVQVDPKGWVPVTSLNFVSFEGYGDAFGIAALMQLLDIRDAIDRDRFTSLSTENSSHFKSNNNSNTRWGLLRNNSDDSIDIKPTESEDVDDEAANFGDSNYDFSFSGIESLKIENSPTGLWSHPEPFNTRFWAEPESNSFRVRGGNYLNDRIKINAASSIGRLMTVDLVEVDKPILTGMARHPTERIQLALKKEKFLKERGLPSDIPPFIFVVNILFPGPPHYHAVMYYAIDDFSTIDGTDGSPSSLLARKFFFDENDEFRDRTFKLIPQVVDGNFMVRKAVGSTPALLGKKIDQIYIQDERFFELICDTSCSAVAANVIRLSIGYARTLVVDMGFVFEGNDEEILPEKLFGCVRLKNIDMRAVNRKVKDPEQT